LNGVAFDGEAALGRLGSAYKDHGYGCFFYALARVLKPVTCVELGVLEGFSLLCVAAALRDNGRGTIHGFDLFEDYPFRHERCASTAERIRALGLEQQARIRQADAFAVAGEFASVDYLHVDLSNDGDTYRRIFAQWSGKVKQVMLLEGGGAERDRVAWMARYRKSAIVPALAELRGAHPEWTFAVLAPFPSLTVAIRAARG
jgi:hypothetical protein